MRGIYLDIFCQSLIEDDKDYFQRTIPLHVPFYFDAANGIFFGCVHLYLSEIKIRYFSTIKGEYQEHTISLQDSDSVSFLVNLNEITQTVHDIRKVLIDESLNIIKNNSVSE